MRLMIVILALVGLVIVDQFKFRGYYGSRALAVHGADGAVGDLSHLRRPPQSSPSPLGIHLPDPAIVPPGAVLLSSVKVRTILLREGRNLCG